MEPTLGLSVALTSLLLYFLPVIIAFVRGHESRWGIFLMTLFLGWTMLLLNRLDAKSWASQKQYGRKAQAVKLIVQIMKRLMEQYLK